ncbi:unnamed protein product [Macrosiphum euphorbiae]|uniref:G-protein coupled receptors family 1 profile domain-containing protein n=1 Tax=Macrosiphum euphorbiae TaxID=13131 RepID=A0AAV0VZR5_9HEMI|nr:unnamed protein product [Macrosiphum euphorbiae]
MSTDINEDLEDEISLTDRFEKYYLLVVVCLGSLGNCISVLVFFGTKLRKQSSSYYLSSLAISDTLFLLIQLMPVLSKVGIGIYHMQGFCQFFVYLAQVKQILQTITAVLSEFSKSGVGSKQTTVNGTWKEVHELIPIAHS